MLWYIIDGWNLVNSIEELKKSPSPREDLMAYIRRNNLTGSRRNKATIVFDGGMNLREYKKASYFEIIFSEEKTADEVINRLVSSYKNKKQIVVVSNDHEIINFTKAGGANSLRVGEFIKKRNKTKMKNFEDKKKLIPYSLQQEINEELKKKWLKES